VYSLGSISVGFTRNPTNGVNPFELLAREGGRVRKKLRGRARCVAPRASADAASAAGLRRALDVGRWRAERFGRYRCLTLRYSLLLSVWVDPSAEHMYTGLTL